MSQFIRLNLMPETHTQQQIQL